MSLYVNMNIFTHAHILTIICFSASLMVFKSGARNGALLFLGLEFEAYLRRALSFGRMCGEVSHGCVRSRQALRTHDRKAQPERHLCGGLGPADKDKVMSFKEMHPVPPRQSPLRPPPPHLHPSLASPGPRPRFPGCPGLASGHSSPRMRGHCSAGP